MSLANLVGICNNFQMFVRKSYKNVQIVLGRDGHLVLVQLPSSVINREPFCVGITQANRTVSSATYCVNIVCFIIEKYVGMYIYVF
jgi:hypothetical protein